jgi:hypothetical protein
MFGVDIGYTRRMLPRYNTPPFYFFRFRNYRTSVVSLLEKGFTEHTGNILIQENTFKTYGETK